jgi:hypothetical protein
MLNFKKMKIKKLKIILLFLSSFLLSNCEDISVVDNNIQYVEYTVVRSELKANTKFEGVQITRTLPLDEAYNINKAEIKNALVFLKINGVQIVPLHFTGEGIYKPLYNDLFINPGYTYELIGNIGNKSIYGITRVPEAPNVQNVSLQSDKYLTANVTLRADEVYGAVWVIINDPNQAPETSDNFFSVVPTVFKPSDRTVAVRTTEIPENLRTVFLRNSTYIRVTAFDKAYLDYFKTSNNDQPSDNAFVSGGGPVGWNVQGEKVIGMFIGKTEGSLISP